MPNFEPTECVDCCQDLYNPELVFYAECGYGPLCADCKCDHESQCQECNESGE